MELTKRDTKMTKGLAIVFMVLLHLFCRVDNLPYECIKIGGGTANILHWFDSRLLRSNLLFL